MPGVVAWRGKVGAMCDICWAHTDCPQDAATSCPGPTWNGEWHVPCRHWWYQYRQCTGSKPPWEVEEARHSDIPKGMARALEDGQLPIIVYRHAALTFRDRDNDWKRPWQGEERTPPRHLRWGRARNFTPWARMFRHPKLTGQDTTQETLSSLD